MSGDGSVAGDYPLICGNSHRPRRQAAGDATRHNGPTSPFL